MPTRDVIFRIIGEDAASPALSKAGATAETAAARVERAGARMQSAGRKMTTGFTLPIIAGLGLATAASMKYEKQMTLLQTAGGESVKKMTVITAGLKKVAVDTGTSLDDLGEGMYTVAKAGAKRWSAVDQLNMVKVAAQGAKAEAVPLGTAMDALSTIMLDYGAKAGDAVKYENMLIRGSGLAKTSMENYAASLSNVVPIAAAAGLSFEQVGGAIATMTQHGVSPDRATENLRNLIFNLTGQNNVASQAMQQLGINTVDLTQNLGKRGLTGTLEIVDKALANHTKNGMVTIDVQKSAALATQSLNEMMGSFTGKVKDQSQALLTGKVGIKDYTNFAKSMGGETGAAALQFLALYKNSLGFSNQLKSGKGTITTTTTQLQKMLGGMTGAAVGMQIGGKYAKQNADNVGELGKAYDHAGKNVIGWGKTSQTAAQKSAILRAQVGVLAVDLGDDLLPLVEDAAKTFTGLASGFDKMSPSTRHLVVDAALAVAAIGPLVAIGGRLVKLVSVPIRFGAWMAQPFRQTAEQAELASARVQAAELTQQADAERAAYYVSAAEAEKALAAEDAAVRIAVAAEGTDSILRGQATTAALAAIDFNAAMQAEADAALASATTTELAAQRAQQALALQAAGVGRSAYKMQTAMAGLGIGLTVGSFARGASTSTKLLATLGSTAGGAAVGFSMGGPWGAALGGLAGGLSSLATEFLGVGHKASAASKLAEQGLADQKQAADDLYSALINAQGAYTTLAKASVVQDLSSKGDLALANKAGIDPALLVKATLGNLGGQTGALSKAQQKLSDEIFGKLYANKGNLSGAQMTKFADDLKNLGVGYSSVADRIKLEDKAAGHGILTNEQLGVTMKKLKADFRGTGTQLDSLSYSGKHNTEVIKANVEALQANAIKQLKAGTSAGQVAVNFAAQTTALRNNLVQMGFSKTAIDNLIGSTAKLPKSVRIALEVEVARANSNVKSLHTLINNIRQDKVPSLKADSSAARATIRQAQQWINEIKQGKIPDLRAVDHASPVAKAILRLLGNIRSKTVTVTAEYKALRGPGSSTYNEQVPQQLLPTKPTDDGTHPHAFGGTVTGKGGPKSDSNLIWASKGEEIIQEPYASKYRHLLKRMNVGAFAGGGTVGGITHNGKDWIFGDTKYASERAAENAQARAQKKSLDEWKSEIKQLISSMKSFLGKGTLGSVQSANSQFRDLRGAAGALGILNKQITVRGPGGDGPRRGGGLITESLGTLMRNDEKTLDAAIRKRIKDADALSKARTKLHNDTARLNQEIATVKSATTGAFDISSAGADSNGKVAFGAIKAQQTQELNIIHKWVSDIHKLNKVFGKSATGRAMLQQLAEAGPASYPQVHALATAGSTALQSIVSTEAQIQSAASGIAKGVANNSYGSTVAKDQATVAADQAREARDKARVERDAATLERGILRAFAQLNLKIEYDSRGNARLVQKGTTQRKHTHPRSQNRTGRGR